MGVPEAISVEAFFADIIDLTPQRASPDAHFLVRENMRLSMQRKRSRIGPGAFGLQMRMRSTQAIAFCKLFLWGRLACFLET